LQSDAELVKACLNGEREAFAELVKRYEHPVRAVALDILRDYHSAADVSQDAFVRSYKNLPELRKAEAYGPWLMKITRRCALDAAQRGLRETALDSTTNVPAERKDGQLDEYKQMLLGAVVKLPEGEKQVVMLRYFGGRSVKDVAEMVGRSVGTVTKQLSRAHRRLRNLLKESER
jgi:RNA polymerase sigma-70 factor (ECF subfamily)